MPIVMNYTPPYDPDVTIEAHVYDFLHSSEGDSFALCWVPSGSYWLTCAVAQLTPLKEKQKLFE